MKFNFNPKQFSKPMRMMLLGVGGLFALIILYKLLMMVMIKRSIAKMSHVITVSAAPVDYASWQPTLVASGSLRAIKGVKVTTELAGMVKKIYFTPGAIVKEGTILVQLNADAELGQLQSLSAQEALAKLTYERDKKQYQARAISKQALETDLQNLKSLQGQVIQQQAVVEKKTIRAPFSGRLGTCQVNPGQYVNPGDVIVSLQTRDPLWVDFYLPQQNISQLKLDGPVNITTESYPNKTFKGKITTINPAIEVSTRNVEVEATLANPNDELTPGMFVTVTVDTGKPMRYLTLPQTAIVFNPYGNLVYLAKPHSQDEQGKSILQVTQAFVVTGETRGEQVAILSGLKQGDVVVTSGMLKLKNNSLVTLNNAITPPDDAVTKLRNEH